MDCCLLVSYVMATCLFVAMLYSMNYRLFIHLRNSMFYGLYRLAKVALFRMDPEFCHDMAVQFFLLAERLPVLCPLFSFFFGYKDKKCLVSTHRGVSFPNPVGLAAGFDKSALMSVALTHMGFGALELGSVTALPCDGNPKPRLWRLLKSSSIVVWYGLKNVGCKAAIVNIRKTKRKCKKGSVVGVSIAATNCEKVGENLENGIADFAESWEQLASEPDVDFITVNISCPNSFGGESFCTAAGLEKLLAGMKAKAWTTKPVFLKIKADVTLKELDAIIEVSRKYQVSGFVCSNLTRNTSECTPDEEKQYKELNKGALSGRPVKSISLKLVRHIYAKCGNEFVIIGCGGIYSAEDAYEYIRNGASLIQLITGMIFVGPQLMSDINNGLVQLLKRDGFASLKDAVGVDVKRKAG